MTKSRHDGGDRLNCVVTFIKRFVALSEAQLVAITLWVAHTHAVDAAETTPYLNITSAEKQCGKTRLLEVLSLLVAKPWSTGSASRAVLVRKFDAEKPTLLLDESDAAFAGDKDYSEALRGVLNNGHSRGGVASLCVGQGANITYKDFQVFCPKAIAGIGKLPDTIADRSIPIRMKRRVPGENIERFRRRLVQAESAEIRKQLADWLGKHLQRLRDAGPQLPESLSDRQQDGCEPLLAIADVADGDWPERARAALVKLLTGDVAADDSIGVRLLSDIRALFQQQRVQRFATADLLMALCDREPQWLEFSHGKSLSSAGLARLLKRYGIVHRKLRFDDTTRWGYECQAFADAWARYLPRELEQVEHCGDGAADTHFSELEQRVDVPPMQNQESPLMTRLVPDVPGSGGNGGQQTRRCYIHGTATQWWERPPIGSGQFVCGRCHPQVQAPTARELGFSS